jgi:hypothetical protein
MSDFYRWRQQMWREYDEGSTEFRQDQAVVFVDGDPEGCKCTGSCEFPCWQRVGLTSDPCCRGCAPLEES